MRCGYEYSINRGPFYHGYTYDRRHNCFAGACMDVGGEEVPGVEEGVATPVVGNGIPKVPSGKKI